VDFNSLFLELLSEVVEESFGAAWGAEALGEVCVGVEEYPAAPDPGDVGLYVLDELFRDLVGPSLVVLLVADEADEDVFESVFLGAGGVFGYGRLLLDLVAEF